MKKKDELVRSTPAELIGRASATGAAELLETIRPEWKARNLVARVEKLIPVDASSACQRLLNAAIHDLRDKIVIAGLDLATEVATLNTLPQIRKAEDVLESYSTSHVLTLSYRMGLISRPDWKRLQRAYDIRRDLEHEDDEYEAQIEDLVYVFRAAIDIVLSREPIELLRVSDVKEIVEAPTPPNPEYFLNDFRAAPELRQKSIGEYLVNTALDENASDIVRVNAVEALRNIATVARDPVKIHLAEFLQKRVKRNPTSLAQMKVAAAGGFLPYMKRSSTRGFFVEFVRKLTVIGHHWKKNDEHAEPLDQLEDFGGILSCPEDTRPELIKWLVLCYIGEPGEYGWYGRNRKVFYSNRAAGRIIRLVGAAGAAMAPTLEALRNDREVKRALAASAEVGARFEDLVALTAHVRS